MFSKYHLPSKVKMIIVFVNLFGAFMVTPQSSQGEDSNQVVVKTDEISFEERLTSMQHMSKLGTAITIYADCNKGKYPKHLKEFRSYFGIDLDWILKNVCYIGAKLTKEAPPDKPIAFDKTMLLKEDGTAVLFNNMLVEFVRPDKLETLGILKGECISDKDQITDNEKQEEKKGRIDLKVVGPNGEALSGAKVYQDYSVNPNRQQLGREYVCDEKGLVHLHEDELFQYEWKRKKGIALYGLYENKLAGFVDVNASDLDKELTAKLTPVCRVFGKIKSTELNDLGQKVSWMYVVVYYKNRQILLCSSEKGKFEVFLPNGKYKLYVGGTRLYSKQEEVEVKARQKELEINFDLLADRLAHLIGKKAPELQQIKGWINSKEIKLADLRSKVVLLDFWGVWCGPCVAEIPALIDLHEKYHDKGLVIIVIHDDSMSSIKELEKKIERLTKERWEGKKIPFAVALDGGGECKIEGTELTVRGATTAAYGIQGWPEKVLIDKKGKVVREFSPPSFSIIGGKAANYSWEDAEVLEELLDKKP